MNALALQAAALQWQQQRRAAVVVEVAATRGSVPRETGTRMLVAEGEVVGSVGGGHLELKAITQARARLHNGDLPWEQAVALGPTLGQCCGGSLTLRYTALAAEDPAAWPAPPPRFQLQLYGAGHVGRAVVQALAGIPCRVVWLDEREAEFPATALPPHIEARPGDDLVAEAAKAPPGAFHLVLTHSHDLDLALAHAILRRGDFGWLGLIGSATKRARFQHRLAERGIAPALLDRMVCPVGLPGIAGKEPATIAVAVVAQLLLAAPGHARE